MPMQSSISEKKNTKKTQPFFRPYLFIYKDLQSLSLVACLWLRAHQVDSLFPFLRTLLFILLVFMAHAYAIINS
jgi:hypothetical protein